MAKEYVEERNGGLFVAGTRVSLDSMVRCFNSGMGAESILEEFDTLTLAQVYGAITHYLENQASVDSYRLRQKRRFESARQTATPLPAELRHRLEAVREHLGSSRSD